MTRAEAIKILDKYDLNFCDIDGNPIPPQDLAEALNMAIKALEQEPKRGKWLDYLEEGLKWKCSECGSKFTTPWHYCPNCGNKNGE